MPEFNNRLATADFLGIEKALYDAVQDKKITEDTAMWILDQSETNAIFLLKGGYWSLPNGRIVKLEPSNHVAISGDAVLRDMEKRGAQS